jgi:hypothetical protein
MTDRSHDRAESKADEAAQLVAEMRASVEVATRQLDELTSELSTHRCLTDDLESIVDVLLGVGDTAVVVIDDARRISGLSRAAAERFDGAAVGKPLSSVLPDTVADEVAGWLDGDRAGGGDGPPVGERARVHPLPGGGAVVVLGDP